MSDEQSTGAPACEEWQPKVTAYADGELPAAEIAALEAHVAACPACAATLAEVRAMKSVLGAWAVDEKYIAERVEARVMFAETAKAAPVAGPGDIDNEPLGAADELRQMRELVASLVAETRGMREEMASLRAEIADMRREQRAAARPSANPTTSTVTRYAVAAPPRQAELLPWAPPADAPAPLT